MFDRDHEASRRKNSPGIKMNENQRMLLILLEKNLWIRKRCWFRSIIFQLLIPIGLILASLSIRGLWSQKREYDFDSPDPKKQSDMINQYAPNITIRYTSRSGNSRDLNETMNMVAECLNSAIKPLWSSNEDEMIEELRNDPIHFNNNKYSIGVVFETTVSRPPSSTFKYKLRYQGSGNSVKGLYKPNISSIDVVFPSHCLGIQVCVDQSYIEWVTRKKMNSTLAIQQMPYPPHHRITPFFSKAMFGLQILLSMLFLIALFVESSFPINEKQSGVQILMTVNGMKNYMNLLSWFISGAIYSLIYTVPIALLLTSPIFSGNEIFLKQTNTFIFWLAIFVQNIHFISFGYHLSAYFLKPFATSILKLLIPIIMIAIDFRTENIGMHHIELYFGIISPNFLLSRIMKEIKAYEVQGDGVGWSNMFISGDFENPSEGSIGMLIIFSIVGILFNFLMAIYINAISPGEYGVPQHPLFFLRKKQNKKENRNHRVPESADTEIFDLEPVTDIRLKSGLQIRKLTKTYTKGILNETHVDALRDVSADFYKGQITALLGHNGAGKTTMLSIWSGLIEASGGETFINGKNIQLEPEAISSNVGLCPQKNILFPSLTVYQHIMFFGALKTRENPKESLEDRVEILLSQINLSEKKNALPQELSGGQKRKLCIAIAAIGNANVLIFDEPTSGIDAESKRHVWDILLKMRGEKTMIISTHDMEEADILGDRIAIMHTGKLRSYGTSMYLKKLYGHGLIEVTLSVEDWCSREAMFKIINNDGLENMNNAANVLSESQREIVLVFPIAKSLPKCLDELENSKKTLGITGISVSTITLDEIFTRVTKDGSDSVLSNDDGGIFLFQMTTGFFHFMQTLRGFLMKKKAYMMKNPWKLLISIFLPSLAVLFVLILDILSSSTIEYNLGVYSPSIALVKSDNSSLGESFKKTVEDFGGDVTSVTGISMQDAFLNIAREDLKKYNRRMVVSAEFMEKDGVTQATGFFSGSARHGIPIVINCLTNTLLKELSDDKNLDIQMSAEFFRIGKEVKALHITKFTKVLTTLLSIIFFLRAVSLYASHTHEESQSGFKHLQCMTGASKISYWISMFSLDMLQYVFTILVFLGSFIILDIVQGFHLFHMTEMGIFLSLFFLFGISVLPFIYLVNSLRISKSLKSIISCYLPIALIILNIIVWALKTHKPEFENNILIFGNFIDTCFMILIPHVRFFRGFLVFFFIASENALSTNPSSYFEENQDLKGISLGDSMIELAASSCLYFFLLTIFELQFFEKMFAMIKRKNFHVRLVEVNRLVELKNKAVQEKINERADDSDVNDNKNVFSADELKKCYGKSEVVKGISFRVKEGECFGLLGVNGAGKSTTFRMLTGIEMPDGGTMYTKNFEIQKNRRQYLAEMGYCPQHDVLIDSLNARDHLYLFARLRGVPEREVKSVVKMWIWKLKLTNCAAQPCSTYSRGNKRRLQVAIAMIGNPSLILMDEPTAGVDPNAAKSIWRSVKSCQARGQSIIFTSHNMGECDVHSNRLAIMIRGQLVCVGATQELKHCFGASFNIHIKLSSIESVQEIDQIKSRIESSLACIKMNENSNSLSYHVTDPKTTWTDMYEAMDSLKNDYMSIEDYSVVSSTFEQFFVQLAQADGTEL